MSSLRLKSGPAAGKTARVASPGPGLEPRLVAEARGAADALGLRLRHHDPALHASVAPMDVEARAVFEALETARVEALGARTMAGVRENLSYLTDARVRGDAIVRARTAEEVPLATAVGLLARERLTGEAPPQASLAGLKLVAPWIEEKAAAELDALALTLDDQAAFARLSRRLLEDLDLAAAEEPCEQEPEEGGDDEEGDQGGDEESEGEQGMNPRPAAAKPRCAARKSRKDRARTGRRRPGDGRGRGRPRRGPQRQPVRLARPPQLGTVARRPNTRSSPPASTRPSRPPSYATRRSWGGCAPISTSRWAGCRASSASSPTGCSGG